MDLVSDADEQDAARARPEELLREALKLCPHHLTALLRLAAIFHEKVGDICNTQRVRSVPYLSVAGAWARGHIVTPGHHLRCFLSRVYRRVRPMKTLEVAMASVALQTKSTCSAVVGTGTHVASF